MQSSLVRKPGWVRANWLNLLFGLVTTAGLIFGIWGWWSSTKERDLVYLVRSPRTVVFQKDVGGDFDVSFKGQPVTADVNGVTLTLWNNGRDAIRSSHVVGAQPSIVLDPPVPIYSTKIVAQTRPTIVNFKIDDSNAAKGIVKMSWDILDADDGASVQLLYAGALDVRASIEADFEGRGRATEVSPDPPVVVLNVIASLLGITAGVLLNWSKSRTRLWHPALRLLSFVAIISCAFGLFYFVKVLVRVSLPLGL